MARDEIEDAEASAKLALGIIDRHRAVLHLPLTFMLAESSRRLLQQPRIGRPSRRLGLCADALRVARTSLAFARPTRAAAAPETAGGDDHGAGKGKVGGWCTFGDAIMAAFDKRGGGGGGGGDVSAEVTIYIYIFVRGTSICFVFTSWCCLLPLCLRKRVLIFCFCFYVPVDTSLILVGHEDTSPSSVRADFSSYQKIVEKLCGHKISEDTDIIL